MPFTLAHPAAVLPLRRGLRLDFSALVIGSMTPDFGYYLLLPDLRLETHSFAGSLRTCLPVGLLLVLLFHVLKRPLCEILPQPHRGALRPLAARHPPWKAAALLLLALSTLLGIWTHVLWDAFTHRLSWGPQHLPLLQTELFNVADKHYRVSDVLQWLSSILGLAILARAYRRWLARQPAAPGDGDEGGRKAWLLGLALTALALALPFARLSTGYFTGLRAYAFQEWVHGAAFFGLMLVAYALLRQRLGRRP